MKLLNGSAPHGWCVLLERIRKKKYSLIKYTPRKAFAIATSIMATKNKRRQQEEKKNCSTDRSEIKCKAASCKMLYTVSKSMKN